MGDISQQSNIPIYGLLVASGLVISSLIMFYEWIKIGGNVKTFNWLLTIGIISGLLGARWIYLIFHPSDIHHAIDFFSFQSGRSILGAVIGGSIGISLFLKVYSIPIDYRMIMSVALPNILLGQAIGRWGNFANQELYGRIVSEESLSWLIPSIRNHMFIDGNFRAPLFLYESIINIIGWLTIAIFLKVWTPAKSHLKPGSHGSLYLMWYGITRASMEMLRDEKFIMKINNFNSSLFLAIIFALIGLVSFVYFQKYYWNFQAWKDNVFFKKTKYFNEYIGVQINYIFRKINKKNKNKIILKLKNETNLKIQEAKSKNKTLYEQCKAEDYYFLRGQK